MNPLKPIWTLLRLLLLEAHPDRPEPEFSARDESCTRLKWGHLDLKFDSGLRRITSQGRFLLCFDEIDQIEISSSRGGGNSRFCVKLKSGRLRTVNLGYTNDDADASLVAARVAEITGRPVRVAHQSNHAST